MSVIPFDQALFALLVCPESRKPVKWVEDALVSTDPQCRRKYPVQDGIPILLVEESIVLKTSDWERCMAMAGPISGCDPSSP